MVQKRSRRFLHRANNSDEKEAKDEQNSGVVIPCFLEEVVDKKRLLSLHNSCIEGEVAL